MEGSISSVFGDALLAALDWTWPRLRPGVRVVVEKLGEALVPDPPMAIRTLDGHVVSGFLIVDRGQVVAFVGTRQAAQSSFPSWRDDRDEHEPFWSRGGHPR